MGYYGRQNWKHYHSDDFFRVRDFSVIIPDLRDYFFNMDSCTLYAMFWAYKVEYGDSAYKYALNTYPKWKSGKTELSSKSLFRLVKTLPHYLSEKQRVALLEKLLKCYDKTYYDSECFTATWDNYLYYIQQVAKKIRYESANKFKNVEIPKELMEEASWICDDDMVLATKIYNQFLLNKQKEKAKSALYSLNLFRETCNKMKSQNAIYDSDMDITLDVFTVTYYLTVKHKERTFIQSISHFFGFDK